MTAAIVEVCFPGSVWVFTQVAGIFEPDVTKGYINPAIVINIQGGGPKSISQIVRLTYYVPDPGSIVLLLKPICSLGFPPGYGQVKFAVTIEIGKADATSSPG